MQASRCIVLTPDGRTPKMTISSLTPHDLRVAIAPGSLEFADTSELLHLPLPWIGQAR